uniref:Putative GH103: Membrane-bound lytic murein transglycosylase B n=1 Tax=Magnetococcus massalia (strain MO-1) TaxID=451514 RepID=A0A1S7LF35_MAGMO|nr:putative GH103 : Membrane-bound lytic murein transglycosylase B [Candidatus Magnetococcus massalia]
MQPWVTEHGMDAAWLERVFAGVKKYPRVIRAMNHQAESKPFYKYRDHITSPWLYKKGRKKWAEYGDLLRQTGARYAVDPAFIIALWGMESRFGSYMGKHPVLRTLYTLSVDYPRRAKFFRSELRHFLLLCQEQGWDPEQPLGSYAGAMGHVQMIPSSMRRYALDENGDGTLGVFDNAVDATASIANYLAKHGWQRGGLYTLPVKKGHHLAKLRSKRVKQMQPWSWWQSRGVEITQQSAKLEPETPMALIRLEEADGDRYYAVFNNFRVILDWNRSLRFAKVVGELAEGFTR